MQFVRGRERLDATTRVLQRARLADPVGGVWEAADLQWWRRHRRPTDEVPVPVWSDELGPCATVNVMDCLGRAHADRGSDRPRANQWQVDLFVVPETIDLPDVWSALLGLLDEHRPQLVETAVHDDEQALIDRLRARGFTPIADPLPIMWMDAADRPPVLEPPDGFRIVDRASPSAGHHPMGGDVQARLAECSLYDPTLDLAMLAPDGQVAGYAVFWADLVTGVGMLEPMRVHEAYQRRGLAGTLLACGLDRLAHKGIRRIKVTFDSYAGHDLHARAVFTTTGSARLWTSSLGA